MLINYGCRMSEPERHNDFMSQSECLVYKNEVESESLDNYKVEFVDTSKSSGCVKAQLNNIYLLYDNESYIVVYPKHPRENLELIEKFNNIYKTDSTKLSGFSKYNDGHICLTISKYYHDTTNVNSFYEWKYIYFKFKNNCWKIDSYKYSTLWPWVEN